MAFRIMFSSIGILLVAGVLEVRSTENPTVEISKTSFTCRGRDAGYYADVEADCQIYHMCDAQGRQFNYACPNETLFQQRMLICDHWYMVDCSSSEANYEFNRLIGQRDQPFVSQSDAEKRTPRPDLLDRPYAADYKGESYRKQFGKHKFQAVQNAISSLAKVENKKLEILETQASTHVLPPQIHSNDLDPTLIPASADFPLIDKNNGRRNADSGEVRGNGMLPPPTGFEPPKILPTYNQEFRNREESRLKQLGIPLHQTSQRVQQPAVSQFSRQAPTPRPVVSNQAFQSTKKPVVKTFDPDKNFKAFEHILQIGKKATHKDYDFSRYFTKKEGSVTVAPVQRRQDIGTGFNRQQSVAQPTTARPFVNNKFSQRTFASTTRQVVTTRTTPKTTAAVRTTQATTTRPTFRPTTTTRKPIAQAPRTQQAFNQNHQNTQLNQGVHRQSAVPTQQAAFNRNAIPASRQPFANAPARDLLPPLNEARNYEDATTKGPPIYFQWKVPERGLLPPKMDNETDEMHAKRSILEEGNFGSRNDFQGSETRRLGNGNSVKIQYKDLQRLFSIPEYEFPIESKGRDGYENAEAVNSFQVKIPYNKKSGNADRYYYLEHAHCNPECHPYFFKPNRCEPCVKL